MLRLVEKVQVNIPFAMLHESYLDRFISRGLNPEIGLDAAALDGYSLSDFKSTAEQLRNRGLSTTFHAPFMDLSAGSPDPKIRAVTRSRFEQVLNLVPVFNPKTVVCHAGYDEKRYWYIKDAWIEKSLEMWSWLGKRIQDEGAVLMLENVYEYYPADIRGLFEGLAGVGFCLDIGHQAVFGRTAPEIWVKELGAYIGQLHLHDNLGYHDEHLAMGKGNIDFQGLFKELMVVKKDPPVITLEPHNGEDLWPNLEFLEKIWPW